MVLREGGLLSMICSGKFVQAGYGAPSRQHLSKFRIHSIVDYGDMQLFRGATTYPTILLIESSPASDDLALKYSRATPRTGMYPHDIEKGAYPVAHSSVSSEQWLLVPKAEQSLVERLSSNSELSTLVGEAQLGVKTSLNEVFVVGADVATQLIADDSSATEILRPFTRGRDIAKWFTKTNGTFLVCTREAILIDEYPSIQRYLNKYEVSLRNRYEVKRGDYEWWVIRQVARTDIFEHPKIIYPDLCSRSEFALNLDGSYPSNTAFCIPSDNHALLAYLNSRLIWFWITRHCPANRGGAYRLFNQYINKLPLRRAVLDDSGLAGLAQEAIRLAKSLGKVKTDHDRNALHRQIDATDRQIDQLVYELYGLTDKEIALVEAATGKA
jgi:hypothetical protein